MSDERMICKHCGHDEFYANVTVTRAWIDSTGVFVGDDGAPHFETEGGPQDCWDYDIDDYACSKCERREFRLEKLVTRGEATSGVPAAPCARCDHGLPEHPELGWNKSDKPHYTRGPMPCDHAGCDCHDYLERVGELV